MKITAHYGQKVPGLHQYEMVEFHLTAERELLPVEEGDVKGTVEALYRTLRSIVAEQVDSLPKPVPKQEAPPLTFRAEPAKAAAQPSATHLGPIAGPAADSGNAPLVAKWNGLIAEVCAITGAPSLDADSTLYRCATSWKAKDGSIKAPMWDRSKEHPEWKFYPRFPDLANAQDEKAARQAVWAANKLEKWVACLKDGQTIETGYRVWRHATKGGPYLHAVTMAPKTQAAPVAESDPMDGQFNEDDIPF